MKKQKIRNAEYYSIQYVLDNLYYRSSKNYNFNNLYEIITSDEVINLAYRNIKNNKGSLTAGIDHKDIKSLNDVSINELRESIKGKLKNYKPDKVRRVYIPKKNGKLRPLGIPTITDRLIQEMIRIVLEPICEAKFHKHSYGFRPNRSTENAMARVQFLVNNAQLTYFVDIDIKGFFDNVNHNKLLKQLWNLGIHDKKVISIIKKILKSEIVGEGIPQKGTPQGGILSPLLANVVLNELDWWLSNQWETFKTEHEYSNSSKKFRALRNTKLKEFYFVRYADDFKIICRDYKTAVKIKEATTKWLNERLKLEVSPEKTKIVNILKRRSEFLGFEIKAIRKGTKIKTKNIVCRTYISRSAKEKLTKQLTEQIKEIQHKPTISNVAKYNSMVLGAQNYYKIATQVNADMGDVAYKVNLKIKNRLKQVCSPAKVKGKTYEYLYGSYNYKTYDICHMTLYPIKAVKTKNALNFNQKVCNYSEEGRLLIHKNLETKNAPKWIIEYLSKFPIKDKSIEYNDSRIARYIAQKGKDAVTGECLYPGNIHCHHVIPFIISKDDSYNNLIIISELTHKLIHVKEKEAIEKYLTISKLNTSQLNRINYFRNKANNNPINIEYIN